MSVKLHKKCVFVQFYNMVLQFKSKENISIITDFTVKKIAQSNLYADFFCAVFRKEIACVLYWVML